MEPSLTPRRSTYVGLFVVVLATLVYEILLTRIFSVTMWYHFAFVAISVAMFGMTVGAVIVYARPGLFRAERVHDRLALSALLFGITVVGTFLLQLAQPFGVDASLLTLVSTAVTYAIISVPFVFSGICVSLALTRFPRHVNRLYAADLVGAAAGCMLVIGLLDVTDGPTAVIAVGAIACAGALAFAHAAPGRRRAAAVAGVAVFGAVAILHTGLLRAGAPVLRLYWVKGAPAAPPLYEKWNSFSRIAIFGDPDRPGVPRGWGLSATYRPTRGVPQLALTIDATAGTVLTRFDGDLTALQHLAYDVTNVAHAIRRNASTLVIGVGGGRDVLASLLFGQRSVVGVEINQDILDTVNRRFGDFTGHLDRHPRVAFVNDEARSYVTRQPDRFDLIQISLIDTWAATAAGAFVLTENSLYTREAWSTFLDRLTDRGVLSVSRYFVRARPDETYRLTALARASLLARGVADPRAHVVIVRQIGTVPPPGGVTPIGVATLLVSPAPFSGQDLDVLEQNARALQFDVVLSPRHAEDEVFATLASGRDLTEFFDRFPVDVTAPTDDRPFFFHTLRLRHAFRALTGQDAHDVNLKAVSVLGTLLVTVVALTVLCVLTPIFVKADRASRPTSAPLLVFFAGIGFGFMLVEISQMQRLIVFLGHPTYSLSVVLFALLVSSGIGSFVADRLGSGSGRRRPAAPLAMLIGVLVVFGLLTPAASRLFAGATTPTRIAVAVAMLLPLGLFMGMAFPLGMRLALERSPALAPWLWGINGATSVCASVVAVVIALGSGISAAFWTGVACYAAAVASYAWATSPARERAPVGPVHAPTPLG